MKESQRKYDELMRHIVIFYKSVKWAKITLIYTFLSCWTAEEVNTGKESLLAVKCWVNSV